MKNNPFRSAPSSSSWILFQSRPAAWSFGVLFVGCLFIFLAGLSLFSVYINHQRNYFSQSESGQRFQKVLKLVQALPLKDLSDAAPLLDSPSVHVHVFPKAYPGARVITFSELQQLKEPGALETYFSELSDWHISVSLSEGQWLNIWVPTKSTLFPWKLGMAGVGLFFAWIFLFLWGIKRLDLPLQSLLEATKRFGIDMQTPPLPMTGPPEVQKVIQAFNEMQQRIRRLLDDRTQMLAAISHDLRTPITRLQLRAEYLKGTPQYEKVLDDLNEMESMIASVLVFARNHVQSEPMEYFDLNALLATICDDLSDMGYAVIYHASASHSPYFGRLGALKRAFNNVIENAIKYGNKAEVSLHHYQDYWQIKVSDEGPGIPPDQLEKVFSPFYRVDLSRSTKIRGTGLGLTVARDIIRAHGGDIMLHNQKPRGLVVLISLPFITEEAS